MKKLLALRSFRLRNFKAVRDSGKIEFSPLTALIGNNGSGKSSLIEGLEAYQGIITGGLDAAMGTWRGFEHVWNQAVRHRLVTTAAMPPHYDNPIVFDVYATDRFQRPMRAYMEVSKGPRPHGSDTRDDVFILKEFGHFFRGYWYQRDANGRYLENNQGHNFGDEETIDAGTSCISLHRMDKFDEWQFLSLSPTSMDAPTPQKRTGGTAQLTRDGANLAEYLLDMRSRDVSAFDGLIDALRFVLPYARDVQPAVTAELERAVYLQMTEGDFKLPGWLLSAGTLRVVALLAALRHPEPPPLIIVEEIENSLDPRTIGLIVEEIRSAVQSGRTQVIVTTHSPYLLDLLPLSSIVVVDRDSNNSPTFSRPADDQSLKLWSDRFSPGQLYTMDRLTGRSK